MPKYSVDGGVTFQEVPAEGLRLIYETNYEGQAEELHINLTHEGVIMDVWHPDQPENAGTNSETYEEIIERLETY